jgi:hypothetical protein
MEPIMWEDQILAYLIRGTVAPEKTVFPTPHEVELQVGFVVYRAGGIVAPHRHAPITRTINRTCEVVLVKKGRCDVDLYANTRVVVATRELCKDDLLLIVSGGHGFRMQEDTVLLEIKQGPYLGLSEKELLQ